MDSARMSRRAFIGGAAAVGAACALAPSVAFAAETSAEAQAEADAAREQLVTLQADLEAAEEAYGKAITEQETAQAAMEAEQDKIDEANARISGLQDRLSDRASSMYKSGSLSAIDFLLGATTFQEFTTNWGLLERMNEKDADLVDETKTARAEREAARDEYARQEQVAAEKADEAAQISADTQARISEVSAQIEALDEEARQLLEAEQAAEAARQAALNQPQNPTANGGTSDGGSSGGGSTGGSTGGGYVDAGPSNPVPSYGSVVDYALSRKGCPYVWGAEGPDAFDCSGLVRWAYLQVGVSLPHYTESLYAVAANRVPVSEARPGDVLYRPGHVGIAVGYGGVPYVHAPTFGAVVRDTDSLSWSGFTCALQFY